MFKFHQSRGKNIEIFDNGLTAVRTQSFANALIFSQRPLETNELFLFEITEHEKGWAGNIRCGITLHNPSQMNLPQYLLPDLYQLGKSFVYAIKPITDDPFNDSDTGLRHEIEQRKLKEQEDSSKSTKTYIMETNIKKCAEINSAIKINDDILNIDATCNPCSKNSRIGFFVSSNRSFYVIINGVQFGPCARHIPEHCNVYAALDLYGTTKAVKIINFAVPRLSVLCKDAIWKCKTEEQLAQANIPRMLKNELLSFYSNDT